MKKKINVVHVGVSGIPFAKDAAVNRCLGIYNTLSISDFNIFAISRKAMNHHKGDSRNKKKGVQSNIYYQYTTPSPYKPNKFIKKRIYKILGRTNEFFLILKLGFKKKIDIMFFYPQGNFFELIYYRIFSKLFRFPLVCHYVEYRSSFQNRSEIWLRINDVLFDKYFMYFVDAVVPISEFLKNHIKKKKDLPIIKIPPLVDFSLFSNKEKNKTVKYFLYVGSAVYSSSVQTILDAFELIKNSDFFLYLVLHGAGTKNIMHQIKNHRKKDLIKIYSRLDYKELINYNIEAQALMIPLSNSIQDRARFPNKISEYLASANPIITTNFGEVRYYFKNESNALVAETDSPELLAEKMNFIIDFPQKAKIIGRNGHKTGLKYFDNNVYKIKLTQFIVKLIKT